MQFAPSRALIGSSVGTFNGECLARRRRRCAQHEPSGWLSASSFSAWVMGWLAARLSGCAVAGKAGGIEATLGVKCSTTTGAATEEALRSLAVVVQSSLSHTGDGAARGGATEGPEVCATEGAGSLRTTARTAIVITAELVPARILQNSFRRERAAASRVTDA